MLLTDRLAIGHGGKCVAEGISHHFQAGTLTLLTGRNGAGKSTLLKTLAGMLPPISGAESIRLMGQPLASYGPRQLARQRAIVLTHYEPVDLLVQQVVEMGRSPYTSLTGRLSAADRDAVAAAISSCRLDGYEQRRFSQLSDGERQRVMIAAAVAQDTPVILLDEPTAFLDYDSRLLHFQLLSSLAAQGKCLVCATHDLDMARRYTTHELTL